MKPLESDAAFPRTPARAGARSDSQPDSFAVSSLFKGLRVGKFRRPASAGPPVSRELRRGWTRHRDSFWFGETVAAVASASSERGRTWRDSNSVSFVFNGLQGGKFLLPPSGRREPTLGPLHRAPRSRAFRRPRAAVRRPAASALLGRTASAIRDSRARAFDASARRRRARHAAAGFPGEHGHAGFSSSEVERRA